MSGGHEDWCTTTSHMPPIPPGTASDHLSLRPPAPLSDFPTVAAAAPAAAVVASFVLNAPSSL